MNSRTNQNGSNCLAKRGEKMNNAIKNSSEEFTYPDEKEAQRAVRICCGVCCNACETPVEYAWRKRKTDMAQLLALAIEKELTERERAVIRDYYCGEMSLSKIAAKECIAKETVHTAKIRAEEKLRRVLMYVRMYQQDEICEEKIRPLNESFAIIRARRSEPDTLGERLEKERVSRGITLKKAEETAGIDSRRLSLFEKGKALPDADEIKALCLLYETTPDRMLDFERSYQ